jgi:hypothetical protein
MGIERKEVASSAEMFCNILRYYMKMKIMAAYDALTDDEREKLAQVTEGGNANRLVRVLGMAVGETVVNDRFNIDAIKKKIPQAKRILKKRSFR